MSDKQLNKEQFAGINLEDNKELDLTKFSGKQEELKELEQDYKNPVAINKPAGDLASPGKAYIDKSENKQKLNETIEMVKGFMPPAYEADIVQQLLSNERLISKDSPEMILVKKKITLVRNAMSSKDEKLYTEKDLNALITLYNEAVGACNAYITDDRKRKSSTRWKLVNENMIQLNEEAMRLETVRDMMSMGNWENKAMTLKQLVMEARKIPLSGKADLAKQRIAYESEFASLKRLQPSITKERYNDLRKSRKYSAIFSNATYTGIMKDAGNKNLRNLSGAASALLSTVRFDEKGHAIEADREIDDNNIAWLGSLATGDLETIRPMIARQARELSDYFAWIENKTGDPAVCVAKFAEDPVKALENNQKLRGMAELIKVYPDACTEIAEDVRKRLDFLFLAQPYILSKVKETAHLDLTGTEAKYLKNPTAKERDALAIEQQRLLTPYDLTLREAEYEKRIAAKNLGENEAAERQKTLDAATAFEVDYEELVEDLKTFKYTLPAGMCEKTIINRLKTAKTDGLPILTDREAKEIIKSVKKDDPDYVRKVKELISQTNSNYNLSFDVRVEFEAFSYMLDKQKDLREAQAISEERKQRTAQVKANPVSFQVPSLSHVVQNKGQSYNYSCWARSGATIVNAMHAKLSQADPNLQFDTIDDHYFLGTEPLDYNEEARQRANAELGEFALGEDVVDDYLDVRRDMENFRSQPDSYVGNLYSMADHCLKATDNRCMVKSMQFTLQSNEAKESLDLLKDVFLKKMNDVLTKNGGNPVSVLNGGHYITITGIKGRNFIYKDPASRTAPDKEYDNLSIDGLFANNKAYVSNGQVKGGALEVVWLEPINEETMASVKQEFPDVATDYEKLRETGRDRIMPQEYAHTQGVDFVKEVTKEEDKVLAGLFVSRVYLPKGKPGEKVISRKQKTANAVHEAEKKAEINREKFNEEHGESRGFEEMAEYIESVNAASFDMSSDQAMTAKLSELEVLASNVNVYREILQANEDYRQRMLEENPSIFEKMAVLSAIADYYRASKLVITNSMYVNAARGNMSMADTEDDSPETLLFKKMLRLRYQAKQNLAAVLGQKTGKNMLPKTSGMENDLLGLMSRGKFSFKSDTRLTKKQLTNGLMQSMSASAELIDTLESEYKEAEILRQAEEAKKPVKKKRRRFNIKMPAEMMDAVALKAALDVMPKETAKEADAYDKAARKYLDAKKKGLKNYISNLAKTDKTMTAEMKAYYNDIIELSTIEEKNMYGGFDKSVMEKSLKLVEAIKANPYYASKDKKLPAILEDQLFNSEIGELEDIIAKFDKNQKSDMSAPFTDNIAVYKFMKNMGMEKNIKKTGLSYMINEGKRSWGVMTAIENFKAEMPVDHTRTENNSDPKTQRMMFTPQVIRDLSNMSIMMAILGVGFSKESPEDNSINASIQTDYVYNTVKENGKERKVRTGSNTVVRGLYFGRIFNSLNSRSAKDLAKGSKDYPAFKDIDIPFLDADFVKSILKIKPGDAHKLLGGVATSTEVKYMRERLEYIQGKLRERLEKEKTLPRGKKTILSSKDWEKNAERIEESLQGGNSQLFKKVLSESPLIEGASHKSVAGDQESLDVLKKAEKNYYAEGFNLNTKVPNGYMDPEEYQKLKSEGKLDEIKAKTERKSVESSDVNDTEAYLKKQTQAEEGEGFNKMVFANVLKGVTKAKEALTKNGGSLNADTLDITYANTQKTIKDHEKYIREYQQELEKLTKDIPVEQQDQAEVKKTQANIKRLEDEIAIKRRIAGSIEEAKKGKKPVTLVIKDEFYSEEFTKPSDEPIFKEGDNLLAGVTQVGDTCYFSAQLANLAVTNRMDFIKNTLVKEHPQDKTKAIVRLHDANGIPVDIVVDKSRRIYPDIDQKTGEKEIDNRALWMILVEKAVAVVMNRRDFKHNPNETPFSQNGGVLLKETDWDALANEQAQGKDFCEKKCISVNDINSGGEIVGARMLFGKEAIVLDNRAGGEADKDEEGYAKEEYLPGSDEVIGQMAEYQKAGKLLIGGTAGCDGIIEEGYEYKTTYNYLSGGVAFEDHAPVSDGHAVCITEVDMKNRTVKLADTMVENGEVDCAIKTLTFGQFRRYFTKVYVVDGPK